MSRHILMAVAALLLTLPLSLSAQKYLRKANKQYELGEYTAAIEGFERYLRKRPEAIVERGRLAYALRMANQLEEAEQAYAILAATIATEGSNAASENGEYPYQHALVLMELGRYKEAVERLSKAAHLGHPRAVDAAARLQYAQANQTVKSAWRVSNEFANTKGDDFGATTAGNFVVYASDRDGNSKMYRTTRDDNNFLRQPNVLHRALSEELGQGPLVYSPSGELVAYTRNNFEAGERFLPEAGWELSLMLAVAGEDGDFQEGKAFVHNGPGFSTGFPAFSPDGSRLYFASDRPGGQGGFDIYVSERMDSGWGAPQNMGDKINTAGNEIAPYAAGESLYFSSDFLPGFGGMDVYRADLMGSQVTSVVNEGLGVNSPLDDVGFAMTDDSQFAYITSNRPGGKGGLDIYRAMRNGKAMTIAVVDGATGKPIANALLDFSDCGQGNFLTGLDGEYTFRAVEDQTCRPSVRKSGYNTKEFSLNARGLSADQRLEVKLNPEDKISIYEGKVIHSRTGDALAGVLVRAQQKDGPFASEARTDAEGRYELKLERQAEYVISYAKAGMADIDREASSYDADGAGILSTFAMFPGASSALADAGGGAASVGSAPAEYTATTSMETSPAAGMYAMPPQGGTVSPGFAVQVAALAENTMDISEYQRKLGEVGQVYGKRENGVLRIRVGPFAERAEAVAIQARVQALGFGDAFVAKESGGTAIGVSEPEEMKVEPAPVLPEGELIMEEDFSSTSVKTSEIPTNAAASAGSYLIRLATYGNFTNFDASRVASLGTLTTRKRGDYVVVLVQGFASAEAAQAKVAAAQAAGFADAHVVFEEMDGTLKKVR